MPDVKGLVGSTVLNSKMGKVDYKIFSISKKKKK